MTVSRPAGLRMARIHLRTGSLALARAELEAAAGSGDLDDEALVDIAEARWRTGDLQGAGEAAAAHIATGGEDLIALVIAAEAAAASRGGAEDAEALVTRVLRRSPLPLDEVVAGMPLGAPWPPGVDRAAPDPEPRRDLAGIMDPAATAPIAPLVPIGAGRAIAGAVGGPVAATPEAAAAADPRAAFAAGSDALAAGDRETASLQLAVALRLSPALAPAILSTVGGTPGPAFDLIRGDAFRIVGHQSDALRCYAAAALALSERRSAAAIADAEPPEGIPAVGAPADAADATPAAADAAGVADVAGVARVAGVAGVPQAATDAADTPAPDAVARAAGGPTTDTRPDTEEPS